jgi:hypothetical protein
MDSVQVPDNKHKIEAAFETAVFKITKTSNQNSEIQA